MEKMILYVSLILFVTLFSCQETAPHVNFKFNGLFWEIQFLQGFTAEQARSIRQNFDYDELTYIAGGGGDHSRYVFLRLSEFFFHTTIRNGKEIKDLPISLNPKVDNFITNSDLGELLLNEYVKKEPVDGIIILDKGNIVYEDYLSQINAMINHDIYKSSGSTLVDIKNRIEAKIYMVVAARDHVVNPLSSYELRDALDAGMLELEGECGHLAVLCEAEKVKNAVETFFSNN